MNKDDDEEKSNYHCVMLLNQKSQICSHTKSLAEIKKDVDYILVIKCDKCRTYWSLDGYNQNEAIA